MSRLIDADALHEALKTKQKWVVRCGDKHNEGYTYDQVHFAIDDAPTIDAVEVVRCKDCKDIFFDDWYKCFSCANLYGLNEEVKPDDFCSHGERKESE